MYHCLIALALALSGCHRKELPKPSPIPVVAMQVESHTIPANVEYVGVAESSHIVELRARVEGYLESIDYKEGSLVKTGALMFVLDQRPFLASVESSKGALERQQAVLWNAEQTKARMIPLYEQNAVSQRDFDNAIADELAAKANVQSAAADLYKAELNLSFASIQSPVTGLASQAKYREGALISPGEQSLLTTLYVVDPIWVNFNVSDLDLLQSYREVEKKELQWPKEMQFQLEAILADGTSLPAEGTIDFTNPAIQQDTGTMLIRGVFPNPKPLLFPGQFVRVLVKGAVRPNALLVPQTAVVQGQNGTFVYVIEEGQAHVRPVTPGDWYQNYWIIKEGLNSGDVVVAEGVNKIQNGSAVAIQSTLPSLPLEGDE